MEIEVRLTYGHSSRSSDRTREMCEPKLRWMPEHSMHTKTPRFKLAQSGSNLRGETERCQFSIDNNGEDNT